MYGPRLIRALTLGCLLVATLVVTDTGAAGSSCDTFHGRGYLTGFAGGFDTASPFYAAEEGGPATATITVTGGDCQGGNSWVDYTTEPASATAPQDYTPASGQVGPLCQDLHAEWCGGTPPQQQVTVLTVEGDPGDPEPAVESFRFRLTGGTNGLAAPAWAPVHVVDDDGAGRASLEPTIDGTAAAAYSRSESFSRVLIPVFLAGPSATGSVGFTVGPGPQSPATPEEDYRVVSPNPLPIPSSRVGFIEIAIVNDRLAEAPESVAIAIPGGAAPASTTLTILDNEESEPPSSRLHHPRHRWKYRKADFRIREVHVFTSDTGGSGVTGAQFALRRNMRNENCQWLTKQGWQKRDCSNRQWLDSRYDSVGQLWFYRPPQLRSSVGSRIKDYTAFSRAIDGAGNVEKDFAEKRNANTFEVKRSKRP